MTEKGKKRVRDVWSNEETDFLLQIIKEKNILDVLDAKKYRRDSLFEKEIVSEFDKKNYKKNLGQIIDKFDNLKSKSNFIYTYQNFTLLFNTIQEVML